MAKPVGSRCNLACRYCYYRDKGTGMMSDTLLDTFTRQYIEAQTMPQVLFTWHGGEPLLRPISFYRRALQLQRRYARGRHIDNIMQTNGTLLNDEWCAFLRQNNFLVGISIDGPQHMHDSLRTDHNGRGSWHAVMSAVQLLNKHGVEWNAMATVNAANVDHPQEFYHFFRDMGCRYLQFTPVVEQTFRQLDIQTDKQTTRQLDIQTNRQEDKLVTPYSITAEQWGRFLCGVYDEWVKADVGVLFVQLFDATLANWVGEPPGVCSLSPQCTGGAIIETDGSVYSCDHFAFPRYRLGNINSSTLTQLLYGPQQQAFVASKQSALTAECRQCEWLFACHGECPRNRFVNDRYGNAGHNFLCHGYRTFFNHVADDMHFMTTELQAGHPPANIMGRYK